MHVGALSFAKMLTVETINVYCALCIVLVCMRIYVILVIIHVWSEQWAVGTMSSRNNALLEQWVVGIDRQTEMVI